MGGGPQMAPAPQIYCDLDDVLTNFEESASKAIGLSAQKCSMSALWALLEGKFSFFETLPWSADGKRLWEAIKLHNPIILSGVPRGGWAEDQKRKWCKRELGDHVTIITCESQKKFKYCKNVGDILIDDRREARIMWEKAGGIFIHHLSFSQTIRLLFAIISKRSPISSMRNRSITSSATVAIITATTAVTDTVDIATVLADAKTVTTATASCRAARSNPVIVDTSTSCTEAMMTMKFSTVTINLCDSHSKSQFSSSFLEIIDSSQYKKQYLDDDYIPNDRREFEPNNLDGGERKDYNFYDSSPMICNTLSCGAVLENEMNIDDEVGALNCNYFSQYYDSDVIRNNNDYGSDFTDEVSLAIRNDDQRAKISNSQFMYHEEHLDPIFNKGSYKAKSLKRTSDLIHNDSEVRKRETDTEDEIFRSYQETINSLVTLIVFHSVWSHRKNRFYNNKEFQMIFNSNNDKKVVSSIYFTLYYLDWEKKLYKNCSRTLFKQRFGAFRVFNVSGDLLSENLFLDESDLDSRASYWMKLIHLRYKLNYSENRLNKFDVEKYISNCTSYSNNDDNDDDNDNENDDDEW